MFCVINTEIGWKHYTSFFRKGTPKIVIAKGKKECKNVQIKKKFKTLKLFNNKKTTKKQESKNKNMTTECADWEDWRVLEKKRACKNSQLKKKSERPRKKMR